MTKLGPKVLISSPYQMPKMDLRADQNLPKHLKGLSHETVWL